MPANTEFIPLWGIQRPLTFAIPGKTTGPGGVLPGAFVSQWRTYISDATFETPRPSLLACLRDMRCPAHNLSSIELDDLTSATADATAPIAPHHEELGDGVGARIAPPNGPPIHQHEPGYRAVDRDEER